MIAGGLTLGISTSAEVEAAALGAGVDIAVRSPSQALHGLLPCITRVLAQAEKTVDDLTLLCVCAGPGSFTGLRIGVTFAKSLAQARGLPMIAVSAYDVAESTCPHAFPRVAAVTAKNDYFYIRVRHHAAAAAEYMRGTTHELRAVLDRFRTLRSRDGASAFAGAGASVEPGSRARSVARLGYDLYALGATADWRSVEIDYGQRPNAVINWEMRRTQSGKPQR